MPTPRKVVLIANVGGVCCQGVPAVVAVVVVAVEVVSVVVVSEPRYDYVISGAAPFLPFCSTHSVFE